MAIETVVKRALAVRQSLLSQRRADEVDLPLRFWRQQAHFTTPATGRPERAIAGLEPVARLLERHRISLDELAVRSGAGKQVLQSLLSELPCSPLVMVDAEDAVADTADAVVQAREGAIRCFREAEWGQALRFFRPAGIELPSCVEDIASVLGATLAPDQTRLLVDGIVWPKVESVDEMAWLCDLLSDLENDLGVSANSIRLEFLVESATALQQLDQIVAVARPRLCGIIWGAADYAADVGLRHWTNDHPLFDWARGVIVNSAGAVGVPAIDAMTFNYPTPIYRGDDLDDSQRQANKESILMALAEVYDDAVHGREMGMSGKWVGHPAQLLMVQAAYRQPSDQAYLQRALDSVASYEASVGQGHGATIIGEGGAAKMADRATDRHLRTCLRRAAATGELAAEKALQAGLINEPEFAELQAMPVTAFHS